MGGSLCSRAVLCGILDDVQLVPSEWQAAAGQWRLPLSFAAPGWSPETDSSSLCLKLPERLLLV